MLVNPPVGIRNSGLLYIITVGTVTGGELSVALTRHQVTCGSKPGVGGIFFLLWPFSVICYLSLGLSYKVSSVLVLSLG